MSYSSEISKILILLQDFLDTQEAITLKFQMEYSQVKDWNYMIGCPKSGSLSVLGKTWLFQKHGAGVRFESTEDHVIVDINRWKYDMPRAFDVSRLVEYFDSVGIVSTVYLSEYFSLISEPDVKKLVNLLVADGILFIASDFPRLYGVVSKT